MTATGMKYVNENCERFSNIGEFVSTLKSRTVHNGWISCESDSSHGDSWYGTARTLSDAYGMAMYGDKDSASDLAKYTDDEITRMNTVGDGTKPKIRNYHVGGSPNVARAMMGLPKDMRQMHKVPSKVKTVDLVYAPCVTASVSSDEIKRRGSRVCAIVTMLERLGYSVKLSVMIAVDPRGDCGMSDNFGCLVSVKDYRECLDVPKVAFMFANASFFRRVGFRWIETYPKYKESGKLWGYGGKCRDMVRNMRTASESDGFKFIDTEDMTAESSVNDWLRGNGFI